MSTVDLNRMYQHRSRERTPIPNSVNVPDAAGAYLRAIAPVAQGDLQAARVQLAIAERAASARNRKTGEIFSGIHTGIETGTSTYNAYMRARARRDEITMLELDNDRSRYLAERAGEIEAEPYNRTVDGGGKEIITGPFSKAKEVWDGWKGAEGSKYALIDTLTDENKARYLAKLDREGYELQADAARKQAAASKAHALQQYKDAAALKEEAVGRALASGSGEKTTWEAAVKDSLDASQKLDEIALGLRDAHGEALNPGEGGTPKLDEASKETLARLRRGREDKFRDERMRFLRDLYADTGDEDVLAELDAAGKEEALPEAERMKFRGYTRDAKKSRAIKLEQDDMAMIAAQAEKMRNFSLELEDAKHTKLLNDLNYVESYLNTPQAKAEWRQKMAAAKNAANTNLLVASAANIGTPELRDKYLKSLEGRIDTDYSTDAEKNPWRKQIADAREDNELLDFKTLADSTLRDTVIADFDSQMRAVNKLEKAAGSIRSERAKQYAYESIMSARAKNLDAREADRKQRAAVLLNYVKYGSRDSGEFKANDVLDIMREFHKLSSELTPDEARAIGAALDDRIKSGGHAVPSPQEVREVFSWLGWTKNELDKTIGELKGDAVLEPKNALILRNADGSWEISAQRFGDKDDKKRGKRDGYAAFDLAGTVRDQQLGKDDISYILDVIHKCKKAALITGRDDYMSEIHKQLTDVKEKYRRDSILSAIRQAQRTIDRAWWMFDRPAEYSTWQTTQTSRGYPVPADSD